MEINDEFKSVATALMNIRNIVHNTVGGVYTYNDLRDYVNKSLKIMETYEILQYDTCMIGDINYDKLIKQYENRLLSKGYLQGYSIKNMINELIECVIYQYQKEYKSNRQLNKWLRNQYYNMVMKYCEYICYELTHYDHTKAMILLQS